MNTRIRQAHRLPTARSQRGTMLIIALIVLVAMTLAGIATMRSVDTATVMAGNIAFRQAALNAADQGIQAGFAALVGKSSDVLNNDGNAQVAPNPPIPGYFSSASASEPDWTDDAAWVNAVQLNGGTPDAAGNVVQYLVQRLCSIANAAPTAAGNTCGQTVSTSSTLSRVGEDNFRITTAGMTSSNQPQYRITARAVGPRRSIAVVQMLSY
jgi:type IV pilus assembly protein PilX